MRLKKITTERLDQLEQDLTDLAESEAPIGQVRRAEDRYYRNEAQWLRQGSARKQG